MKVLIYTLPIVIVVLRLGYKGWRIMREGLFLALMQLTVSVISAIGSFLLTRLCLNPARVDLFGWGEQLVAFVPQDFFTVMPKWEALLRALPTALIALAGFTVLFDVMRWLGVKLLKKMNTQYGWSNKFLKMQGEKLLTACTGVVLAAVCLMPSFVILCGILPCSVNMLHCADAVLEQDIYGNAEDILRLLDESPLIRFGNALGADDVYYALTTAKRNGEDFSVGQELNQLSGAFVSMLPVLDALNFKNGQPPSAADLRQLSALLGESEEGLALVVSVIRSYSDLLRDSDAIEIMSTLMDTEPERFAEYLQQLDMETAQDDLRTFCEVVAILSERDLLPASGELFDKSALEDDALKALIRAEIEKNSDLSRFFYDSRQ